MSISNKGMCRFIMNHGTCKFGINCKFSHQLIPENSKTTSNQLCRSYSKDKTCKFGDKCMFVHKLLDCKDYKRNLCIRTDCLFQHEQPINKIDIDYCSFIFSDGGIVESIIEPICCRSLKLKNEATLNLPFNIQGQTIIFDTKEQMLSYKDMFSKSWFCLKNSDFDCTRINCTKLSDHLKLEFSENQCNKLIDNKIHIFNRSTRIINEDFKKLVSHLVKKYPCCKFYQEDGAFANFSYITSDQQKEINRILKVNLEGIKIKIDESLIIAFKYDERTKRILKLFETENNVKLTIQKNHAIINFNGLRLDAPSLSLPEFNVITEDFRLPNNRNAKKLFFDNLKELKNYNVLFILNPSTLIIKGIDYLVHKAVDAITFLYSRLTDETKQINESCCFCNDEVEDKVMLLTCKCVYCEKCLIHLLKSCEYPKKCICDSLISVKDLCNFDDPKTYIEKYLQMNWQRYGRCLTPDCEGFYEKGINKYKCHICQVVYCVICEVEYYNSTFSHEDVTCEVYKRIKEQDSKSEIWLLENTKSCPRCEFRIQKNGGCNHMTCSRCRYEFCWVCLIDWARRTCGYYQCRMN